MLAQRLSTLFCVLATLTILAAATTTVTVPPPTVTPGAPANQCNTGTINCCDAAERSDGSAVGVILALLGVVLQGVEGLVGITCTPIDIVGLGQNSCAQQPLCCSNQNFKGIIAIGCVPININL